MNRYVEERLVGIRALFSLFWRITIWCKPCLLILDNLDKLLSVEIEVCISVTVLCVLLNFSSLAYRLVSLSSNFRAFRCHSAANRHSVFHPCDL
jgi:hypothetical protein